MKIQTINAVLILVFKTNLDKSGDLEKLSKTISGIPGLSRWNIDLEDCDRVLRVEAHSDIRGLIMTTVRSAGFYCEELED
jgi:hypothetical protein